jgi:hypothetical protein
MVSADATTNGNRHVLGNRHHLYMRGSPGVSASAIQFPAFPVAGMFRPFPCRVIATCAGSEGIALVPHRSPAVLIDEGVLRRLAWAALSDVSVGVFCLRSASHEWAMSTTTAPSTKIEAKPSGSSQFPMSPVAPGKPIQRDEM